MDQEKRKKIKLPSVLRLVRPAFKLTASEPPYNEVATPQPQTSQTSSTLNQYDSLMLTKYIKGMDHGSKKECYHAGHPYFFFFEN